MLSQTFDVKTAGRKLARCPALIWLAALPIWVIDPSGTMDTANAQEAISLLGTDIFFPPEMSRWREDQDRLRQGLVQAEKLRQRLLGYNDSGQLVAELICQKLADFQLRSERSLEEGISVRDFSMTGERLLKQLKGEERVGLDAFSAFDGRWFGKWGDAEVNHDWQPSEHYAPGKQIVEGLPAIKALQYAWISNGFGWNYLVQSGSKADASYVLGMVYYLDGADFSKVTGQKAHVGFADSPSRLIWITEKEVFLEEMILVQAGDMQKQTYAITALYHDLFSKTPSVSNQGTQAIYTRDPNDRPKFRSFGVK